MLTRNKIYGLDAILLAVIVLSGGCVQRTIKITSEPTGALVRLNDEEVGRTPVEVSFLYYGVYDVRLEHEGYEPLWTNQTTDAPWWEFPGPDIFAEMIPDVKIEQQWHFEMEKMPTEADDAALVQRAKQLQKMAVE